MKTKTNLRKVSCIARTSCSLTIKSFILSALILAGIQSPVQPQVFNNSKHSWWFGTAAGINENFYGGSTQGLNSVLISPAAFHKGSGEGLYFAPLVEFHRAGSRLGVMLQVGYDSRKGSFEGKVAPCNCLVDLSTDLSYVTVEPNLRFAPFKSDFYLYGGPRLAFNLERSFVFTQEPFSDIHDQKTPLEFNNF